MAHFEIHEEVRAGKPNDWQLCFQYGEWHYDPEQGMSVAKHSGYRFIWRRPDGTLQGARGQARLLPKLITILLGKAAEEGWYPVPPVTDHLNPVERENLIGLTESLEAALARGEQSTSVNVVPTVRREFYDAVIATMETKYGRHAVIRDGNLVVER